MKNFNLLPLRIQSAEIILKPRSGSAQLNMSSQFLILVSQAFLPNGRVQLKLFEQEIFLFLKKTTVVLAITLGDIVGAFVGENNAVNSTNWLSLLLKRYYQPYL